MGIILKFTWRNIKENKFRTFLIVLSVMLSAALFFGSVALSGTIEQTYTGLLKKYFGSAEIRIRADKNSPSPFVSAIPLTPFLNEVEYAVGMMTGSGFFKTDDGQVVSLDLQGYEFEDVRRVHQLVLAEERGLLPFNGKKLVISRGTAEKYGISTGDTLKLEINGEAYNFRVAALAEPVGLFREDGRSIFGVVPMDFLSGLNNIRGRTSVIYIKLQDPLQKHDFISRVSEVYPRYKVEETIRTSDIKDYTDRMTKPFLMMVTTVILISIFIIYTSFKVIALERIPVIGTFRSIGATRRMVNTVFLGESLMYGMIGGVLGCILGIGILHVMARLTTPNWVPGLKTQVVFSFSQLIAAFLVAVLVAVISSFLPIWKVSRIPVKDIVLNNIQPKGKTKKWKYGLGFAFVLSAVTIPSQVTGNLAMPVATLCGVLGLVGIIIVIPPVIEGLIVIFSNVFMFLFGNEGLLALKNLRDNKNIANNVALLTIGISSLLMIKITGSTVMTEVTSFFRDWNFQVIASPHNADRNVLGVIRTIPGVTDAYGVAIARNIEVLGTEEKIGQLEGINRKFFQFMNSTEVPDPDLLMDELDAGRNIILSKFLFDRLNLQVGDTIQLKSPRGPVTYRVIGFWRTIENNGQYGVVSDRYLKLDMDVKRYSYLYLKTTGDAEKVRETMNKKFNRAPFWNETVANIEEKNTQMNAQMFMIMDGFSYMTIVIGIFGVLNNYIIGFLERRRFLAVLRSVGLSRKQMIKMMLIEAFAGGFIGGAAGLLGGLIMVSGVPYVLHGFGLKGELIYSYNTFIMAVAAGIIISVIASVSPALKSSRTDIVASLKYE